MQLEWMGEYREVVESLIHYCNVYAGVYKKEMTHGIFISVTVQSKYFSVGSRSEMNILK